MHPKHTSEVAISKKRDTEWTTDDPYWMWRKRPPQLKGSESQYLARDKITWLLPVELTPFHKNRASEGKILPLIKNSQDCCLSFEHGATALVLNTEVYRKAVFSYFT